MSSKLLSLKLLEALFPAWITLPDVTSRQMDEEGLTADRKNSFKARMDWRISRKYSPVHNNPAAELREKYSPVHNNHAAELREHDRHAPHEFKTAKSKTPRIIDVINDHGYSATNIIIKVL